MEQLFELDRIRVYSDRIPFMADTNHMTMFSLGSLLDLLQTQPELMNRPARSYFNYYIQRNIRFVSSSNQLGVWGDFISLYNSIYTINGDLIAGYVIDCDISSLTNCANTAHEEYAVITSGSGEIIGSNCPERMIGRITAADIAPGGSVLDDHLLIARYDVPLTDWTLTVCVPAVIHAGMWHSLGSVYVIVIVVTFLTALLMGILILRHQTRRLQTYYNAVSGIDYTQPSNISGLSDRLEALKASIRNPDEVDHLMDSFSRLVRDNLHMMNEAKQHDLEIEKYKFQVLQEQINPHFLYNALETLRLCLLMEDKEKALESLDSLSRFYRIALSKGRDTISIREELDMIRNYLSIESIGYKGAIQWRMDVDEECLDLPIPKFLLQPLVENSILHSKVIGDDSRLQIDIGIHIRNDNLEMVIGDNGAGIEPQTLAELQKALDESAIQKGKNGFGLNNVNRRLKLFYGPTYGLKLRSEPGRTENIISLPVEILW